MSVSLKIAPLSDTLHVFGEPDQTTAYSLSGHVSLSLSSPRSFSKLFLKSLTLTFEGHSELIDPETGYSAVRLCNIQRELAPSQMLMISNEGHDGKSPTRWDFVFNLPIPGWLPASAVFGSQTHGEAGTRYALFAKAQFLTLDDDNQRGWSLSQFCSPFTPKIRVFHAKRHEITLVRFNMPICAPGVPLSQTYTIKAESGDADRDEGIPIDVLSKVEVLASVPEAISVDDDRLPFVLRLRAPELERSKQSRLRLLKFDADIKQYEKYRTSPSPAYAEKFPLPSPSLQPPNLPLSYPHRIKSFCDVGLFNHSASKLSFTEAFSLLPDSASGSHRLEGKGLSFADDSPPSDGENSWFKIDISVPFSQGGLVEDCEYPVRRGEKRYLRTSMESPLFSVRHELHLSLTCAYDLPDQSDPLTERLNFVLPLNFALPTPSSKPTPSSTTASVSPTTLLPPYSHLFHCNGDRKIDYSTPLPLYTPSHSFSKSNDTPASPPVQVTGEKLTY